MQILLNDYLGLIGKETSRFIKRWGNIQSVWEYDDLFHEGILIFYNSLKTFDPEKGKFTTHLVHALRGKFLQITLKSRAGFEVKMDLMDECFTSYIPPNKPTFFKELSENARLIIDTLCDAPEGFISFAQEQHKQMSHKCLLTNYFGITKKEIAKIEREVSEKVLSY